MPSRGCSARNGVLTKPVGRTLLTDEFGTRMRLHRHFLEQLHAVTVQVTQESDTLHVLREVVQRIDKAGDGAFSFVLSNDWLHDCVIWKKQVGVTGVISIPLR